MNEDDIQPETLFNIRKSGVNTSQMRQLRNANRFHIIELHGLTQREAEEILVKTLASPHAQHLKIIHGKGNHSPNGMPTLKTMVYNFLNVEPKVLAFCSAKPNDGGAGATYVLTKKDPPICQNHPDPSL